MRSWLPARAWIASFAALGAIPAACTPQGACDIASVPRPYCADGMPACTGREHENPDKKQARKDREACCAGRLLDDRTWESGPIAANWLPYDAQYYWAMTPRDAATNARLPADRISEIHVYIATNAWGSDSTLAAGNFGQAQVCTGGLCTPGTVLVRNETCAGWFVRVVVHAAVPSPTDAGAE